MKSKLCVNDLKSIEGLELITKTTDGCKEICDIYTGDLLSWVMGHVRDEGVILLTVLNTVNLIAVATLVDLSAIVFCENVVPTQDVIDKAEKEGINLLTSNDTTFHTANKIYNLK